MGLRQEGAEELPRSYRRNFYSVSHLAVGKTVDLRVTDTALEVYLGGERLATHPLFPPFARNRYSTHAGDMPEGKAYREWDAARIRRWADRSARRAGRSSTGSSSGSSSRSRGTTRRWRCSGSRTSTPRSASSAPAGWRSPRAGRPRATATSSPSSRPTRTGSPTRAGDDDGRARRGRGRIRARRRVLRGGDVGWSSRWTPGTSSATWGPPTSSTPSRRRTRRCAWA